MSPCLFNFCAEYIKRNARLDESQAGIKIAGRNIDNLRYADDTTLMAESEDELKSLLTEVKEQSGKTGLKLNIQKTKIRASSPITSWQVDGEAIKAVRDLISWAPKALQMVTAAMNFKKRSLHGRKAMKNLDSSLKSRHHFADKGLWTQVMVFPVVMHGCESCMVEKAECQRIDAFQLWCWRRLLESPLDSKEMKPVILKEINSKYSLEGLILKLQYFDHLMRRTDSLEKTLMLGKSEGRRRRGNRG